MSEAFDVVVVGGRCAGSAAAITFANRGAKVVVLDSSTFPSDTLSTHLFFPNHWAEIEELGALEPVRALGAPLHTHAGVGAPGVEVLGPYRAYGSLAAGACVRRPGLDLALVETARAAGAEVRERTRVTDVLFDGTGRVTGVSCRHRDGSEAILRAPLVVGADGRRSTVARLVGARTHHRQENRRMMAYAYYQDVQKDLRHIAMQWRVGDDLVTAFPCDGDQLVALLMPPVWRADEFRRDSEAAFDAALRRVPQLAERLHGCTRVGKIRTSYSHPSYFRHSHGPGWALAGDAGHFKDPVTAQGIRDALRFGRLLAEATASHLYDAAALDRALAAWERDRDAQCLDMYQWANGLGRGDEVSPIEFAAYRWLAGKPGGPTELLDVFSRSRAPATVFTPRRLLTWVASARRDPAVDQSELWRTLRRDLGRELARAVEKQLFPVRRAISARRGPEPKLSAGTGKHRDHNPLPRPDLRATEPAE